MHSTLLQQARNQTETYAQDVNRALERTGSPLRLQAGSLVVVHNRDATEKLSLSDAKARFPGSPSGTWTSADELAAALSEGSAVISGGF